MKRLILIAVFTLVSTVSPVYRVQAQIPIIDIIKAAVKKAIKAVDLEIQRQQNKVIWLQNAQKALENTMSKAKLDDITGWVDKQKNLYKDYYDELKKVKAAIAYYQKVRDMAEKQAKIVDEYKRSWSLFRQDKHFTQDELDYMGRFYAGVLEESGKNIDELYIVVNSFQTQMSDAQRLALINEAANKIEGTYNDLRAFNQQGILLSLQRAHEQNDIDAMRKFYNVH